MLGRGWGSWCAPQKAGGTGPVAVGFVGAGCGCVRVCSPPPASWWRCWGSRCSSVASSRCPSGPCPAKGLAGTFPPNRPRPAQVIRAAPSSPLLWLLLARAAGLPHPRQRLRLSPPAEVTLARPGAVGSGSGGEPQRGWVSCCSPSRVHCGCVLGHRAAGCRGGSSPCEQAGQLSVACFHICFRLELH